MDDPNRNPDHTPVYNPRGNPDDSYGHSSGEILGIRQIWPLPSEVLRLLPRTTPGLKLEFSFV